MVVNITGMHRSGTSMVARLLNLCGVYLGKEADIISAAEDNTEGFWENVQFVNLNNEILKVLGGAWDLLPEFRPGWQHQDNLQNLYSKARTILADFEGVKTWGWKDPRNCLTMPFWQELIPDQKVVICVRNPHEVAKSLYKRGYASNSFGYTLWEAYNKFILESLKNDPGQYIITNYDSYFIDARSELKRVLDFLGLQVEDSVINHACQTASLSNKHNFSSIDDFVDTNPPAPVVQFYIDLCAQSGQVYWGKLNNDLNVVSNGEDAAAPELTRTGLLLRVNDKSRMFGKMTQQITSLDNEVHQKVELIKSKDDHLRQTSARLARVEFEYRLLQDSIAVKTLLHYRKFLDRFLPEGTYLRNIYNKIIKFIRILLTEGPGGFWRRLMARRQARIDARIQKNTPLQKKHLTKVSSQNDGQVSEIYSLALASANGDLKNEYVNLTRESFSAKDSDVKLIAFYLPQYHPIPENDEWWGKGFTEWANVSKAVPQFPGHYQPHLPGELGFYDLRIPAVQRRQVELAKQYGIFGFCFYYYWFNGKRLLEHPLDQFVSDTEIDFPFCLCWANENWTRRWDGQESEILIGQNHSLESDISFIQDIVPYLKHKNYIKIDGRPLVIVYRPQIMPEPAETARRWKEYIKQEGLGDIYLVAAQTFGLENPESVGFDAAVEFPPHGAVVPEITNQLNITNPNFQGKIYNYQNLAGFMMQKPAPGFTLFRTLMTAWDNTARRQNNAHMFINSTPAVYEAWLQNTIQYTRKNLPEDKRFIFINAWNEWAEGTHLEPDRKFGYAYLQSTMETLRQGSNKPELDAKSTAPIFSNLTKKHQTAVILHLYYPDVWEDISSYLKNLNDDFDFYVSIPVNVKLDDAEILKTYPDAHIYRCKNQGRDILPFIQIFKSIYPLNYAYVCKIHTKKTTHRENGDLWRKDLLDKLLGSEKNIQDAKTMLDADPNLGLIAPRGHILPGLQFLAKNEKDVLFLANKAGLNLHELPEFNFIAGSMFWFTPKAISPILFMGLKENDFGIEKGLKDGTLAHAFERFFGLLVTKNGYKIEEIGENSKDSPKYDFAARMPAGHARRPSSDPVIIYQVGKVGSRSILLSLQKTYQNLHMDVPVHHVHVLANLDELENNMRKNFANPVDNLAYIRKSKELRRQIDNDQKKNWKIISLVRDPVARNIGSFFQNLYEYIPDWQEQFKNGSLNLDLLQDYFLNNDSIHIAADWWFEQQLKPVFGIDVFESDFPKEVGYKIYTTNPRANLLLIRLENLNDCVQQAMEDFLGIEDFKLYNTNVGDEKDYAELYRAFKEKPLPREYVEKMYSTTSAKHFYSQEELDRFAKRWLKN